MAHKAIIKAVRKDLKWYYNDRHDYILDKLIYDYERTKEYSIFYSLVFSNDFELQLEERYLDKALFETGMFTVEEKEIDSDILQEGLFIWVDEFNDYCRINKVEVNNDGSANYHIGECKVFNDNVEKTRIKAIENWLESKYPEVNNYEEMVKFKDDRCKHRVKFEELKNKYEKKSEISFEEVEEKVDTITENFVERPSIVVNEEDSNYGFWSMVVFIGLIATITLGVILASTL